MEFTRESASQDLKVDQENKIVTEFMQNSWELSLHLKFI